LRAIAGATLATAIDAALLTWALGGWRALLAHPRALALLGVWLACALVLAFRHPVRAHRPAATERESPLLTIALFVLPIAAPPLAALGERLGLAMIPGGPARAWAGVALVAFGLSIRIAAMTRLGSRFSPLVVVQEDHALETGGLYAYVRHPGYLGALLAACGAVLAFGSAAALAVVAVFAWALGVRAAREERLLAGRFGEAWEAYRRRTGAFLPRPRLAGPRPLR
jgi:protein-S-isoprenylcysteine O-methyltransferase Ste14